MPWSDHRQLTPIIDIVLRHDPNTVLDIGIGNGLYGTTIAAYHPTHLIGIEPWSLYRNHRYHVYLDVIARPWPQCLPALKEEYGTIDLALMIDVIEHYDHASGAAAVAAALDLCRCVVIATPHDPMRFPQDDLPNPYEKHQRRWTLAELARLGRLVESHRLPDSIIAVLERG